MKSLRSFIEQYSPLTEEDWKYIQSFFEPQAFQRNQFILEPGQTCRYFYFMEEGLIRFFYLLDGDDITKTFAIAPYCFTAKTSFRKQAPSDEGIQALDDTLVWRTSFVQYSKLEKNQAFTLFMRKILNEIQEFTDRFFLDAKTLSAEERYLKLQVDYPADLLQKIPLKHLSSFLGIAPQSLSRIRKRAIGE